MVAEALELAMTGMQMPEMLPKEKDLLIMARSHGDQKLGLSDLCGDEEEAGTVERYLVAKGKRDKQFRELGETDDEGRLVLNYLRSREDRLRRVRVLHEAESATVLSIKKTLRKKMQALGLRPTNQFRM